MLMEKSRYTNYFIFVFCSKLHQQSIEGNDLPIGPKIFEKVI